MTESDNGDTVSVASGNSQIERLRRPPAGLTDLNGPDTSFTVHRTLHGDSPFEDYVQDCYESLTVACRRADAALRQAYEEEHGDPTSENVRKAQVMCACLAQARAVVENVVLPRSSSAMLAGAANVFQSDRSSDGTLPLDGSRRKQAEDGSGSRANSFKSVGSNTAGPPTPPPELDANWQPSVSPITESLLAMRDLQEEEQQAARPRVFDIQGMSRVTGGNDALVVSSRMSSRRAMSEEDFLGSGEGSFKSAESGFSSSTISEADDVGDIGGLQGETVPRAFYHEGVEAARAGKVEVRTVRLDETGCSDDVEFRAKVHCLRMALSEINADKQTRSALVQMGRRLLCGIVAGLGKDPVPAGKAFDKMAAFLERKVNSTAGYAALMEELRDKGIANPSLYDIAFDFVLLDAFDRLSNPPSFVAKALANTWIASSVKGGTVEMLVEQEVRRKLAAVASKDSFFAHFYDVSLYLSPPLARGCLSNEEDLAPMCEDLKRIVQAFVVDLFAFDGPPRKGTDGEEHRLDRFASVGVLAEDIMRQFGALHDDILTCATQDNPSYV